MNCCQSSECIPKDSQAQLTSPEGLRQVAAAYMQGHPEICRDLFKYQEQLRQVAPTEVPRMGFWPVVPVVPFVLKVGLAAWTVYKVYATTKDIVHDPKVQKSWEERNYIDIFNHTIPHFPILRDAIRGGRALALDDSKGAWLYPANALFTIYGGKVIGKGGRWIFKKVTSESKQIKFWEWLFNQGAVVKQPSKLLTIPGSGEWKSTKWNIGEAAVHKKHHNWHKIFGDKKPTLKEIDPYVKEALTKGQWRKTDIITKKGKIIGDKIELVQEVNGHKIWLGGMRTSTGEVIINNSAVQ